MKKSILIAAVSALACGLPNAAPAQKAKINLDLSGTWKIGDSSESKSQPKIVEIRRIPGTRSYYARFTKSNNKCPVKQSARPMYLSKISPGAPNKTYRFKATGQKVPGRLMVKGNLVRCSSKGFIKKCAGKEIRNAKFGAVLIVDRKIGKVVRIKGTYRGHYWRVKKKQWCARDKSGDRNRFFTLRRLT